MVNVHIKVLVVQVAQERLFDSDATEYVLLDTVTFQYTCPNSEWKYTVDLLAFIASPHEIQLS
jgi:hypothetical protein